MMSSYRRVLVALLAVLVVSGAVFATIHSRLKSRLAAQDRAIAALEEALQPVAEAVEEARAYEERKGQLENELASLRSAGLRRTDPGAVLSVLGDLENQGVEMEEITLSGVSMRLAGRAPEAQRDELERRLRALPGVRTVAARPDASGSGFVIEVELASL